MPGFLSRPSKSPDSPRAFSLLELLVVVSVIGVLVSIMTPSLRKVREDARQTVCLANMKNIGVGMFSYSAEYQDYGPTIMAPLGSTAPRTLLSRSGSPVNLGLLASIVIDTRVYLCPSQRKFNFRPTMEDLDRLTIGGSYAYAVHLPAQRNPRFGAIRHLAMASDDFVARNGDVGIGRYSHRVGYNVLYTDGSALWYTDPDESVWRRSVHWDDERDNINYQTLYDPNTIVDDSQYGDALDIFRVWHSFCYSQPDQYPDATTTSP